MPVRMYGAQISCPQYAVLQTVRLHAVVTGHDLRPFHQQLPFGCDGHFRIRQRRSYRRDHIVSQPVDGDQRRLRLPVRIVDLDPDISVIPEQCLAHRRRSDDELPARIQPCLLQNAAPEHPGHQGLCPAFLHPGPPSVGAALLRPLPYLLIKPRYGEEHARPHLGKRVRQRTEIVKVIHLRFGQHIIGRVSCQDPLDHMTERQKRQIPHGSVPLLPRQQIGQHLAHPRQLRVGEHDALWLSRRAGGVADRSQILRIRVHRRCGAFRFREECVPGNDVRQLQRICDGEGHRPDRLRNVTELLCDPLIADKEPPGPTPFQKQRQFFRRRGVIDRHAHSTHQPNGLLQDHVRNRIDSGQCHPVAGAHAVRPQSAGDLLDAFVRLRS